MNLESLRSLQKRIREATGPDRFLDADIWRKLIGDVLPPKNYPKLTLDPDGIGPCVALQRAVLPGWKWDVFQRHISEKDEQFSVWLSAPNGDHAQAYHRFEPRARLLVIVGALIAQESGVENAS